MSVIICFRRKLSDDDWKRHWSMNIVVYIIYCQDNIIYIIRNHFTNTFFWSVLFGVTLGLWVLVTQTVSGSYCGVDLKSNQASIGYSHKFCDTVAQYIFLAGQILDQRPCGWVYASFGSLQSTFLHPRDWNIGVKALVGTSLTSPCCVVLSSAMRPCPQFAERNLLF